MKQDYSRCDIDEFMENTGFNIHETAEFYVMLFKKFREVEELLDSVQGADKDLLKPLIHDLKSAAGNLCVKDVYEITCEMDRSLNENNTEKTLKLVDKLKKSISNSKESITGYFKGEDIKI